MKKLTIVECTDVERILIGRIRGMYVVFGEDLYESGVRKVETAELSRSRPDGLDGLRPRDEGQRQDENRKCRNHFLLLRSGVTF